MKFFRLLIHPTLFIFIILVFFPSCKSTKSARSVVSGTYRAAFYNVENLFDTLDNTVKLDDDFTPAGANHWNTERYFDKLTKLSKVVAAMGYPDILGVCEVENDTVLKDLINETSLKNHNYQIVHFQSPDERGIDNALIYKKEHFEVTGSKNIRIDFPKEIEEGYTSRDIIYVEGKLAGNVVLHIFINHWPSRRGGTAESEPKRLHVATYLRQAVDEIFKTSPQANILIMGDLNDETNDKSVMEILGANTSFDKMADGSLYNCMAGFDLKGEGSYKYRGAWNMLDNIIVSTALAQPGSKTRAANATIFQTDWMMYDDPKYGIGPSRSYGGPNYYGGYSDHLPVFVDIVVE